MRRAGFPWMAMVVMRSLPAVGRAGLGRPNVIFMLTDDLGGRDPGCLGSPGIDTQGLTQTPGDPPARGAANNVG